MLTIFMWPLGGSREKSKMSLAGLPKIKEHEVSPVSLPRDG